MGWNVIPGCVAFGWFLLCVLVIGPALNGGSVDFLGLYAHLGDTPDGIISGLVTHPSKGAKALWTGLTGGNLAWGTLLPFLLLPLLRPRWIIMAAPIFLQHLLSWRQSEWSINFHYAAPLVPLLWLGTAEAGSALFWRDVLAGWVAVGCAAGQLWFGPIKEVWHTVMGAGDALWAREWKSTMLAVVEKDASVTAGIPYLSHLTNRKQLYSLHHVLKGLKTLSRAEYKPPTGIDAVVMDTADRATFDPDAGYFHPQRKMGERVLPASDLLLHHFMGQHPWHVVARNELAIYLAGATAQQHGFSGEGRKLDEFHALIACEGMPPRPGDSMLFAMSWEVKPKRQSLLAASLYLKSADGHLFLVGKGPIAPGVESGRFSEAWAVRPSPSVPPGKYRGILLVYDPLEASGAPERKQFKRVAFDVGEFNLAAR
jgi:hypothetical protein